MLVRIGWVLGILVLAVSCQAASALPVGTLNSTFGTASVSGVPVPSGTAVFSGDTIETRAAKAVFTFTGGDSVMLGPNARIRVSQAGNVPAIEVLKGMSRVQLRTKDFKLVASKWTLEATPDAKTGRTIADVLRDSTGVVSLSVQEGELLAKSAAGKPFAVAKAGRPTMLPASAVPPAASAPPPQGGGPSSEVVLGAYLAAAAAGTLGVIALLTHSDTGQIQGLIAQNNALQDQVNSLLAQLNALAGDFELTQSLIAQLAACQAELASIGAELSGILARVADGTDTAADRARLDVLRARQDQIITKIGNIISQLPRLSP